MDISLDQTLENSDKHRDNLEDESTNELAQGEGQQGGLESYQFPQSENGQVTYRVVQVGGSDDNPQATLSIVSANGIPNLLTQGSNATGAPQVTIVANPFNESGEQTTSNSASGGQGAKFGFFPNVSGTSSAAQDLSAPTEQDQQGVAQGQFYVMMSPQDMLQSAQSSKHQLAPRSQFGLQKMDNGRNPMVMRDSNRRVQHNEVERRRRDKINNWIVKLSKLVPECAGDQSKQGQSKGGILAKTCDYIAELQTSNMQYAEHMREYERLQGDMEVLRAQLEEKKQENMILHQTLRSHGLAVDITSTNN